MAERHRQGLCFNCNEKYSRGHNRFCRRLFFVEGVEIDDTTDADAAAKADPGATEAPVFSLHAVAGVAIGNTMQVCVLVGTTPLIALLDTGSTHSFIAEEAARRTGLPIQPRPRLTATVANGERVPCPGVLRHAPLTIDGSNYAVDLFVMPLAGYDVVLGTQWMATLGKLVWDLMASTVSFQQGAHRVCWVGVPAPGTPGPCATTASDSLLEELLAGFAAVFSEPTGLPPPRGREHAITLKPGAQPVAVRPYRYPAAHKDELECQCATMMAQGIVCRSNSAFSSPVLLVKKPDGSWQFCVDYRALNALTVKDAFPIPVVDELLDELHGARFFTKLDLRSGYHQVRMRAADVHKTAFHTHDGLYEFLVMPFGLCNAPTTFQSIMNDVLRPYLRHFVLVFLMTSSSTVRLGRITFVIFASSSPSWAASASLSSDQSVPSVRRPSHTWGTPSQHPASPWTRQRYRPSMTGLFLGLPGPCAASSAWRGTTASSSTTTGLSLHR
jgi:hypothetical protein